MKLSWIVEENDHNMNNTRVPKLVYEYVQTGRRNVGWPWKRWRDMKAKKAWHALYPVGADDDLLRNSFLTLNLVFPAIN